MAETEQANTQRNISKAGYPPRLGAAAGPENVLYGEPGDHLTASQRLYDCDRVNILQRRNWACGYPGSKTV